MRFRSRLAAGFAASILLITLTACAGQAGDPGTAPTAQRSASTSPSATPTPTESAIADQDPSTWVVTAAGIGPVELGMPLPDAVALMPDETRNDTENCAWTAWWSAPDERYQFVAARPGDTADDGPVHVVSSMMLPDSAGVTGPLTAEGIGVGSSLDEVEAAYPGADFMDTSDGSAIGGQRFIKLDGTLFLTFYEGATTVSAVTVTTLQTPPYELCG